MMCCHSAGPAQLPLSAALLVHSSLLWKHFSAPPGAFPMDITGAESCWPDGRWQQEQGPGCRKFCSRSPLLIWDRGGFGYKRIEIIFMTWPRVQIKCEMQENCWVLGGFFGFVLVGLSVLFGFWGFCFALYLKVAFPISFKVESVEKRLCPQGLFCFLAL